MAIWIGFSHFGWDGICFSSNIFDYDGESVWFSGSAVQGGAVGPMMLGSSSVSCYATLSAYLYPQMPLGWAVLIAWLGSVGLISLPAWLFLQKNWKDSPCFSEGIVIERDPVV